ncbi:MAG: D-2-hydroxyacid dehydrogenase [Acetobacteraceae bacterium]|nr:D-2-hydroxyacid dehydrogenase [Acetobacteraceae bacterium]
MSERTVIAHRELPFDAEQWARLRAAIGADRLITVPQQDGDAVGEALRDAEIAILTGDLDERFLAAPGLRWVHCDHAGLTKSARPGVFEKGLIVTGSAGRSGPALAEHAIMFMLLLCSNYPAFYEAQKGRRWRGVPGMEQLRALYGRTIGILGMGHTGTELAVRAKAFGMHVLGYRRRDLPLPLGVDRMYCSDRGETIRPILEQCDVLALVLNLSDATYRLIGRDELARMKPSAILVNLSRGGVCDESALIEALENGRLAGAGLDVTETEPLPSSSPLWTTRNVLITPHFTPAMPDKSERSLAVILDNLQRFREGRPMRNQITKDDVFTH